MEEVEKAYAAGIIDGEGSITLVQHWGKRTYGRYVYPLVRVANTQMSLSDWLSAHVPYKAARRYTSAMNARCKPVYHMAWAATPALSFLEAVRPYLVVKAAQADLVLALARLNAEAMAEAGGRFGHGREVPEWLRTARREAFEQMAALNKRGVVPCP